MLQVHELGQGGRGWSRSTNGRLAAAQSNCCFNITPAAAHDGDDDDDANLGKVEASGSRGKLLLSSLFSLTHKSLMPFVIQGIAMKKYFTV